MKQLNRWVYAIVGVIVLLFAGLVYAWSVLSTPIAAEFTSWTKAQLSLTFTIVMILFCIGSLLCGLLSGKLSAKMSVRIGAVLFLLGFFLASRTQSVAMLYIGFGVLCGLSSGLCYNAVMSTMVRWFPDRPGLISGVLLMGFGGGSFIIGKLYQAWTPDWIGGWRVSFVVLGIIIFVVLAICSFFFVAPGADFVAPAAKSGKTAVKAAGRDHKPLEMVKKPTFWLYYVWAIAVSAAGLALISQASGVVWEASADQTAGAVATIVGLISICNAGPCAVRRHVRQVWPQPVHAAGEHPVHYHRRGADPGAEYPQHRGGHHRLCAGRSGLLRRDPHQLRLLPRLFWPGALSRQLPPHQQQPDLRQLRQHHLRRAVRCQRLL